MSDAAVVGPTMNEMEKDPVCGMDVDPATATDWFEHGDHRYVFCCDGCRDMFAADPAKYLAQKAAPPCHGKAAHHGPAPAARPAPGALHAIHTCPMHPEVRREGPGACPDCGMALEPIEPVAGTEYVCPMHPEIVRSEPGA